jgi:hypothetical protein
MGGARVHIALVGGRASDFDAPMGREDSRR